MLFFFCALNPNPPVYFLNYKSFWVFFVFFFAATSSATAVSKALFFPFSVLSKNKVINLQVVKPAAGVTGPDAVR